MAFEALEKIGMTELFSELGKRMFLPQGIFYWSGRAKKESKINATIGSAAGPDDEIGIGDGDQTITFHLPMIGNELPGFNSEEIFPYAPITGLPELRKAWKEWVVKKCGDQGTEKENLLTSPVVMPGITGGLTYIIELFVSAGESIVCPDKRWGNYDNTVVRRMNASFQEFQLFKDGEFNTEGFAEAVRKVWETQNRVVAVMNFPNNPTGYVPNAEVVSKIKETALSLVQSEDKNLILVFDDAYEGYVYDEDRLQRSPFIDFVDIDERILPVKLDGISKEMLFYGGRLGFATFGIHSKWLEQVTMGDLQKDLDNKVGSLIRSSISNNPRVVQSLILNALENIDALTAQRQRVINVLTSRVKAFRQALKEADCPNMTPDPFQAGFFAFLNLEGIKASDLAEKLLVKYATGVVPIERGDLNGIRVAFCSVVEKDIPTMVDNICKACAELSQ